MNDLHFYLIAGILYLIGCHLTYPGSTLYSDRTRYEKVLLWTATAIIIIGAWPLFALGRVVAWVWTIWPKPRKGSPYRLLSFQKMIPPGPSTIEVLVLHHVDVVRISIPSEISTDCMLTSIKIGKKGEQEEQLMTSVPGIVFSEYAVPIELTFPHINPGDYVTLGVHNLSDKAMDFAAVLIPKARRLDV